MSRSLRSLLLLGIALAVAGGWFARGGGGPTGLPGGTDPPAPSAAGTQADGLPAEALATLDAIRHGGPFRYDRDGTVFQNREGRLPERPRGFYREYTVPTPGSRDRGARRIVTGGDPPQVFYYSDDHYESFRRIEAPR